MDKLPFLLVAESSLLGIIQLTLSSLEKNACASEVYIVVPGSQVEQFRAVVGSKVSVIAEDDVLPGWPIERIRGYLGAYKNRAGWYLQQFLKLSFGQYLGLDRYVVWDSDTVLLRPLHLWCEGKALMNMANEFHMPYFATYRRLFGRNPTLKRSMISQYMVIDSEVCRALQVEICERAGKADWVETVLSALPGVCESEFSEYETYANYTNENFPEKLKLQTTKWFRYGSAIFHEPEKVSLAAVERRFAKYFYVSFERHPKRMLRNLGARLFLLAGVGS